MGKASAGTDDALFSAEEASFDDALFSAEEPAFDDALFSAEEASFDDALFSAEEASFDDALFPAAESASAVRFAPGRVILHRHFVRDRLTFLRAGYVVAHDDRGLRLWLPHGGAMAATMTADGLGLRDMTFREWTQRSTELTTMRWLGPSIFMYIPTGAAHSVWWFWNPAGTFVGWYINLEEPGVCWDDADAGGGIDITDQDLDVWVNPDRTWAWKDEDELTERLAFPEHYWVSDEAPVRAEGLRMIARAKAGEFPFDGTWNDFRPDPAWGPPAALPSGWRRPRMRQRLPRQGGIR